VETRARSSTCAIIEPREWKARIESGRLSRAAAAAGAPSLSQRGETLFELENTPVLSLPYSVKPMLTVVVQVLIKIPECR
jgi:hypothetical protein